MHAIILSLVLTAWIQPSPSPGFSGSAPTWSPDGEWLAFLDRARSSDHSGYRYRIWATRAESRQSVLIEESAWPLSAPVWGPRGRVLAFGRFAPAEQNPPRALARGRFEVVSRSASDPDRVIVVKERFVLDRAVESTWGLGRSAWSRDGSMLALDVPGVAPALAVIRMDEGRVEATLEGAMDPAFAPDARQLAFIGFEGETTGLFLVERKGLGLAPARRPVARGVVWGTPRWDRDGGSLYLARFKPGPGGGEVELARVFLDRDSPATVLAMGLALHGEAGEPLACAWDVAQESERCLLTARHSAGDTALIWGSAAEHHVYKRFHPLDPGIAISALAMSPDGGLAAFRVEGNEGFGEVGLLEPAIESTWLIAANPFHERAWRSLLADRARGLLAGALVETTADEPIARPAGLPLPGELDARPDLIPRLARLARLGNALPASATDASDLWDRLFLEYLGEDHAAALALIEQLEPFQTTAGARADLLSIKAQILWSAGDRAQATAIVKVLRNKEGLATSVVEDTPEGPVVTRGRTPRQAWLNLLSTGLAVVSAPEMAAGEPDAQPPEPGIGDPFVPKRPVIELNEPALPARPERPPRNRSR